MEPRLAGPAPGASGSEQVSSQERKSPGELSGLEEVKPFPATVSSGFAHGPSATLRPEFTLDPVPPALVRSLQGERWTWR